MPFWIEGWVEVTRMSAEEQDEHAWQGVLRISPLVDIGEHVSEQLFGLSKACVSSSTPPTALAAARGIPMHPSAEVRSDLELIRTHESQYGAGEFGGYTYATWREIAAFRVAGGDARGSDWDLVFDMVERLAADERFGNDQIRFVVWYNW